MPRATLLFLFASAVFGQSPSFDAASVKTSESPGPESITINPGVLTMRNISLRRLVGWAWEAPRSQITGPSWLADERYDVVAKTGEAVPLPGIHSMLQTLLVERLGLRIHEERKELPVYFLALAKNGPRFHEVTPKDGTQFLESSGEGTPQFSRDKVMMVAVHVSMADLSEQLSEPLERPVIDQTGLKARYDLRLDPSAFMTPEGEGANQKIEPISLILSALPAQLGLKVTPGRDTVRFWVVDGANRVPSAN